MDTTATATITSTKAYIANNWRPHKRISEREFDFGFNDDPMASMNDIESNHVKRFRSTAMLSSTSPPPLPPSAPPPPPPPPPPSLDAVKFVKVKPRLLLTISKEQTTKTALLGLEPVNHTKNGLFARVNLKSEGLSPITEISQNMFETSLDDSKDKSKCQGKDEEEEEAEEEENANNEEDPGLIGEIGKDDHSYSDGGTPLTKYCKSSHMRNRKFKKITLFFDEAKNEQQEISTAINGDFSFEEEQQHNSDELNSEGEKEETSYQMPRKSSAVRTGGGLRYLNASSTLSPSPSIHDNMAVDDLSFYDDDALTQQRSITASPPLMGLLSPEGSPRRFQIVERPSIGVSAAAAVAGHQKLRKSSALHRQKSIQSSTLSSNGTPAKNFHSVSSGSCDSTSLDDDEYMELFEMESLESQSQSHLNFPSDLNSLISGHIKHSSPPVYSHGKHSSRKHTYASVLKTPEMRRPSVRRCLSMTENQQPTPKTPELLPLKHCQIQEANTGTPLSSNNSYCFKRPEPPGSASNSPILSKRYRSNEAEKENLDGSFTSKSEETVSISPAAIPSTNTAPAPRHILRKSMSMNDAEILSALARSDSRDQPDLIGDFSKPFALPLIEGRHCDLKSVSSDTVAKLINGEFKDQVASYKIIDCRYPYEFEGGHIRGAKNLYTHEQIIEEFLTIQKTEPKQPTSNDGAGQKRNIIIFHCEFSSERGPKLSRFLRNHDRARNTNVYPELDYPEIYLLHNGYKEFYETHSELCEPVAYRPMLEPAFSEAYRHFRAKSKSWNGDGGFGGGTSRMKKSRSRLLL